MKKNKATAHKKTRNAVNLPSLISYAVNASNQINYWNKDNADDYTSDTSKLAFKRPKRSSHTPSVKNKYYKRAATHIKNTLFDSKAKTKSKIALNTYHKYLSVIRAELKRQTKRNHPLLQNSIESLALRYPAYASLLHQIPKHDAEMIGLARSNALNELLSKKKDDADKLYTELKKTDYVHPLISLLTKTDAQVQRRSNDLATNLDVRKSNVMRFNYHEIMNIIDSGFESSDFNTLSVAIALATGRRSIEIVYTGDFKKSGENDLIFSGQAKRGVGVEVESYNIPTLVSADRIIDAFHTLRSTDEYEALEADYSHLHEKVRNAKINQRVSRMLNYRAKQLLDPSAKRNKNSHIESPRQFKDTRTIATKIALDKIHTTKKYSSVDTNVFIKNYLGHDDYEASKNYQHILIDYNEPKAQAPKKIELSEIVDIKALELMNLNVDATHDRAVIKLHDKVKAFALRTGTTITQAAIYKGKKINGKLDKAGGSLPVVKRYLAVEGMQQTVDSYNSQFTQDAPAKVTPAPRRRRRSKA